MAAKRRKPRTAKPRKHQPESPSPLRKGLITAFFFVSGATSLALEVAWSKELSYLLGVDIYAATTVVTAFMAGLGLGALLAARLFRRFRATIGVYGVLQLVIGACGLISIPLFRATQPLLTILYAQLNYASGFFLAARFAVVFGLMLLPVTLMGMTLPVVVGASTDGRERRFASLTGRLYGFNTLGAVTGTLLAGFLLVPNLGLLRTCLLTGLIDLLIGLAVLLVFRRSAASSRPQSTDPEKPAEDCAAGRTAPGTLSWPIVVFALSGLAALGLEVVWFRILARIIGPSVHAFAIMLVLYLAGIGSGSLAGSLLVRRQRDDRFFVGWTLAAGALGGLLPLTALNELPFWYGDLFRYMAADGFTLRLFLVQAMVTAWLILPATIPLGMLFPMIARADDRLSDRAANAANAVGRLYFGNTLGAVSGCLLMGFWALPMLGVKRSLVAASLLLAGLAVFLLLRCHRGQRRQRLWWSGALVGTLILILAAAPPPDQQVLNAGLYSDMVDPEQHVGRRGRADLRLGRLLMFREGINNSVAVVANKFDDGNLTLHLTGGWVSTTEFHGRLHLRFLGHLPMLFARAPEAVAVIGYGTGITTGTVLLYPTVRKVDVFELESGVIDATRYFDFINHRPLEDSRTRVFTLDGRSHMTYEPSTYDVVTADPIHPFVAGAANLYSQDFYRIAERRLNDGGIFCQWIPLTAISEDAFKTVLNSIHSVFPHTAIFTFFGEAVVIASRESLDRDWSAVARRFDHPRVKADFESMDILSPYNLKVFLMGAGRQVDAYLQHATRINTDDNVWLEHRIPQDLFNRSVQNLFFELEDFFKKGRASALQALFPGLDLNRMRSELDRMARNGDHAFKLAAAARERQDRQAEELYLRETFLDFNSRFYYQAGLRLVALLAQSARRAEAYAVLRQLQFNHPAFPEAFREEVLLREASPQPDRAILREALKWGMRYNPEDEALQAAWRRIQSSGAAEE